MEHIREMLAGAWGQLRFVELLVDCRRRIEIITTFMALLEMIRLGEIVARQYEEFGDIWLFEPARLRGEGATATADGGDAETAAGDDAETAGDDDAETAGDDDAETAGDGDGETAAGGDDTAGQQAREDQT
jgi:hypothetical protein